MPQEHFLDFMAHPILAEHRLPMTKNIGSYVRCNREHATVPVAKSIQAKPPPTPLKLVPTRLALLRPFVSLRHAGCFNPDERIHGVLIYVGAESEAHARRKFCSPARGQHLQGRNLATEMLCPTKCFMHGGKNPKTI